MRDREFRADFEAIAKRTLAKAPREWAVFRLHYLLGADWRLCSRQLKIDKGEIFHAVYRAEAMLGRAFVMTQPYPLFPIDEYYAATGIRKTAPFASTKKSNAGQQLANRVPLKRVA